MKIISFVLNRVNKVVFIFNDHQLIIESEPCIRDLNNNRSTNGYYAGYNHGTLNISSPPSLSAMTVKALIAENLANKCAWPRVRNVVSNYVFMRTKTSNSGWDRVDDTTALSQLDHLTFCNKVRSHLLLSRM